MSIIARITAWIMAVLTFLFPWINKTEPKEPGTYEIENKSVVFYLDSNPSTGYQWTYDVYGKGIKFVSQEYTPSVNDENIVGSGGITSVKFVADGSGEFEIIFQYLRPWENRIPAEKISVKGCTDKDGNITIKNYNKI